MKTCRKCKLSKPLSDFNIKRSRKDGLQNVCKPCATLRQQEYRQRNPDAAKKIAARYRARLHSQWGATPEVKVELLEVQGNLCAICRANSPECVDHDHITGKVRGLLCIRCNTALGMLGDNLSNLRNAVRYLRSPPIDKCDGS